MNIRQSGNNIYIKTPDFDLEQTFDCGQCFRWTRLENGDFHGVAFGRELTVGAKDDEIIFYNTTEDDFKNIWSDYFDLDTDYSQIKSILSQDEILNKASKYAHGIRILNQDPWETVCSFIISQNNNIPRIRSIIERMCEQFGEQISSTAYSFPSVETIAKLLPDDLSPLRAGFRNKYIIDAAQKIAGGQVDIEKIKSLPTDKADALLQTIRGIGPKVSSCVLLFGFHRVEAFPIDVWIKRALDYFYKDGFPEFAKPYGGIAQQYIFHYIRTCETAIPDEYKK